MFKNNFIDLLFYMALTACSVFAEIHICDQNVDDKIHAYCQNSKDEGCRPSANECHEWCSKSDDYVNWTVINSDIGKVKFSIMPSPINCCHKGFEINLYLYEGTLCSNDSQCKHSYGNTFINNCTSECSEMIEFEVDYVFTATYYLEIKETNGLRSGIACYTKQIFIETNYEKVLIGNSEVKITPEYRAGGEHLTFSVCGGGNSLDLAELVILYLGRGRCDDDSETILSQGYNKGECCFMKYPEDKSCTCEWRSDPHCKSKILICKFSNITPGNYCLFIELNDPRCARHTLWTDVTSCSWYHDFQFNPVKLVSTAPPSVTVSINHTLLTVIVLGCVVTAFLAFVLCFYLKTYPKKIYQGLSPLCAPLRVYQLSAINKPQILLLYPRDCEEFMKVMQNFRCLLQEFLQAQVYDMWDIENWENVNESGHHWATRYIIDRNVKIIIVASSCSRMFENALINKKAIEYRKEPTCFDNIFLYSFKESITLANCSTDNYNRFFVVRLDESACEENKFVLITPCTVYTIPRHLKDLTLHIHNMDTSEIVLNPEEISKINELTSSMAELRQYKEFNPDYLNELISVVSVDR